MKDLISRQAAIDEFYMATCDVDKVEWAEKILNRVPTAERHGKWLDGYGFAGNYYDCFVCDQCKKESIAKTNYCPNCGARMDGEQ